MIDLRWRLLLLGRGFSAMMVHHGVSAMSEGHSRNEQREPSAVHHGVHHWTIERMEKVVTQTLPVAIQADASFVEHSNDDFYMRHAEQVKDRERRSRQGAYNRRQKSIVSLLGEVPVNGSTIDSLGSDLVKRHEADVPETGQTAHEVKMMDMILSKLQASWGFSLLVLASGTATLMALIIFIQCVANAGMGAYIHKLLEQGGNRSSQWEPYAANRSPRTSPRPANTTPRGGDNSLKKELERNFKMINEPAHLREARKILKPRMQELFNELVADGSVDKDTLKVKADKDSKNVYAKMAAGTQKQTGMDKENDALGEYQSRYFVCSNRRMDEVQWNTKDPEFIPRVSMSQRHRYLTTKDLDWQWFNPVVFGIVPKDKGGVDVREALKQVEDMEAAARHYVENIGGWSNEVGLFFHPYPHNGGVNALFIHVLDMKDLGMGFGYHVYHNCPLDVVKTVLQEEIKAQFPDHRLAGDTPKREVTHDSDGDSDSDG